MAGEWTNDELHDLAEELEREVLELCTTLIEISDCCSPFENSEERLEWIQRFYQLGRWQEPVNLNSMEARWMRGLWQELKRAGRDYY